MPAATAAPPSRSRPKRTPLTAAQRDLCADPKALRLARVIAAVRARGVPAYLRDDVEPAALLGLVEAARTFRPGRGLSFTGTHAPPRIHGAVTDMLRAAFPLGYRRAHQRAGRAVPRVFACRHTIPRDWNDREAADAGCGIDPRDIALDDLTADTPAPGAALEAADAVVQMTRRLPAHLRRVVVALYTRADCLLLAACGRALGLCERTVSVNHTAALDTLREQLRGMR